MARLSQGILGGVSGKIGNLVGSSWKGIAVIKTKALSVANPRTAGQVAQRTKMENIVAYAQYILASFIKPLNDRFAQGMSGFNLFVSRNIAFFDTEGPGNSGELQLAMGKMQAVNPSTFVADVSLGTCVVTWDTSLIDAYAQATDKVYLLIQKSLTNITFGSAGVAVRSAGTLSVPLDPIIGVGDVLFAYLVFLRSDGSVVSVTGNKSTVVIA